MLQRIRHCLKTAVTKLALSQRENHDQAQRHRERLTKLKNNAETDIRTLRAEVVAKSKDLFTDIKRYLSTPMAEMRICAVWKSNEIPAVPGEIRDPRHWLYVKQRVDEAFYDRVCTEIEEWTEEKNMITKVENEIVANIEARLGILQGEIIESEYDMGHTTKSSSSEEGDSRRKSSKRRVSLRPAMIELPTKMPLKMNFRLPTFSGKRESKKFTKDPQKWTKTRSSKLLKRLLENKKEAYMTGGPLDLLIMQLMYRPNMILDTLERKIPSIIEANMNLLNALEELSVDQHRHSHAYEKMAEDIEHLKQSLMNYGDGYIFVHDFKSNEVKVIEEQASTGRSFTQTFRIKFSDLISNRTGRFSILNRPSLKPQGLWSFLSSGMLQRDGKERPISIRLYTASSGIKDTFSEVAKLR